jgi:hypothetical protein
MNIRSKLPDSFGVKQDHRHPRSSECISLMNKWFSGSFGGNGWNYYGITLNGSYDCWDKASNFGTIISIDEFFQMIEASSEITNYPIY